MSLSARSILAGAECVNVQVKFSDLGFIFEYLIIFFCASFIYIENTANEVLKAYICFHR